MKKSYLRKRLVFTVVLLFFGASVVSGINCDVEKVKNIDKIENFNCGAQTLYTADDTWWNNDWLYRKELGISNASADYQMILEVWKEDGHDDAMNGMIDCEDHCNLDFSDIRFVDIDQITLLSYWIEKTDTDGDDHYACIWVKTSGHDVIYMYYGNPNAVNESNGEDTFLLFDDFNDDILDTVNRWTVYDQPQGSVTESNGYVLVSHGHSTYGPAETLRSQAIFDPGSAVACRFKFDLNDPSPGARAQLGLSDILSTEQSHEVDNAVMHTTAAHDYFQTFASSNSTSHNIDDEMDETTWGVSELRWTSTNCSLYYNDSYINTSLSNIPSISLPVTFTADEWWAYGPAEIYVDWVYVRKYTLTEQSWESFGKEEEHIPDLDCDGSLSWTDVEPSSTVTGEFTVENIGDPTSELDWEIESYPEWGNWTFEPDSGTGLTPEDGEITVDVEVVAPDEPETGFEGEIKIVNTDDPSDYCIIDVSLATPVSQEQESSYVLRLFQRLVEQSPALKQLFSSSSIFNRMLNLE